MPKNTLKQNLIASSPKYTALGDAWKLHVATYPDADFYSFTEGFHRGYEYLNKKICQELKDI